MKKPVYLLSAGVVTAALAALLQPALEAPALRPQPPGHQAIQPVSHEQPRARVFTLSGTGISSPAQPQRWVF